MTTPMTTPPLDLPALKEDLVYAQGHPRPWEIVDPDDLAEAIARAVAAEEESKGLYSDRDMWQDRAHEAEAAIARVREVSEKLSAEAEWALGMPNNGSINSVARATRGSALQEATRHIDRALDGGA